MQSKKGRLNRNDFSRFFASGRRAHNKYFQVVYTPYHTLHISVVVPKKVARQAVKRNKLRRKIYHILKQEHKKGMKAGVYIIIVKEAAAGLNSLDLKEMLKLLIGKIEKSR